MMPQKINPDVLELIRGKSATPVGALQALLMLIKGLPTAYNRDLQEDKRHLLAAADTVLACLEIAEPIVRGANLKIETIRNRLESGFLDATTLMEYLIVRGVPMRSAHHRVGQLVRRALDAGCRLSDLKLQDFQAIDASLDESVYEVLGVERAVAAFRSRGSTAPEQVERQIATWREKLG